MNYDQVIDKINALEERLDVLLLTMQIGHGASASLYDKLDRMRNRALVRQRQRDEEDEIKSEYWKLKLRLQEIESDYPNLVK